MNLSQTIFEFCILMIYKHVFSETYDREKGYKFV